MTSKTDKQFNDACQQEDVSTNDISEELSTDNYTFSMKIEAHHSKLLPEICKNLFYHVSQIDSYKCEFNKNGNLCISIKISPDITYNQYQYYVIVETICQCLYIEGGDDSYAIVKFYKGNNLSECALPVYEDFITPGYTIDISKFERFINEIIKNDLI